MWAKLLGFAALCVGGGGGGGGRWIKGRRVVLVLDVRYFGKRNSRGVG